MKRTICPSYPPRVCHLGGIGRGLSSGSHRRIGGASRDEWNERRRPSAQNRTAAEDAVTCVMSGEPYVFSEPVRFGLFG
jgi:hypothetical protein